MKPRVSVVIPTHQPVYLHNTLDQLVWQSVKNFEVILSENGEKSACVSKLFAQFSDSLDIHYVHSDEANINVARNNGVNRSRADIIAFTDDDCLPDKRWIENIVKAHQAFSSAGVIGGRVELKFETTQPGWLVGEFLVGLSYLDYGKEIKLLDKDNYLVGANMSFRREVFVATAGFPENIGMKTRSKLQLGNDEIGFFDRVASIYGQPNVYFPAIKVTHYIPQQRLLLANQLLRRAGQGISNAQLYCIRHDSNQEKVISFLINDMYPHQYHTDVLNERISEMQFFDRDEYLNRHVVCKMAYLTACCSELVKLGILPECDNDICVKRGEKFAINLLQNSKTVSQQLIRIIYPRTRKLALYYSSIALARRSAFISGIINTILPNELKL